MPPSARKQKAAVLVFISDLLLRYKRIHDQVISVQIFISHGNGCQLGVLIGFIIINAFVRVTAAGVIGDLIPISHLRAATLLSNTIQNVKELTDTGTLTRVAQRIFFYKGGSNEPGR